MCKSYAQESLERAFSKKFALRRITDSVNEVVSPITRASE
jgi:hypothetical protein